MRRFSIAFLGLLFSGQTAFAVDAAPRRLRNDAKPLETTVAKLYNALLEEQNRPKWSNDNHFSRRLAAVDMQHKLIVRSKKLDSMKEAIGHFNAAQGEHDDMPAVVSHLKSAFSKMNSFVTENQSNYNSRNLQEDGDATVSGADFRDSVQCVAQAAMDNDMEMFLSCADAVKQGIQTAISKIDSALVDVPTERLEELAKRWKEQAQNADSAIAAAMEDPGAIAFAVTEAIEHILEQPVDALLDQQDFLQLLWMVPVSVVWGSLLWMFIGLWEYGPTYGIIGSLWFEISWILSGLGCFADNPLACGVWNP